MKAWLVKPVKHDLSSRSSVFTPVPESQKPKYYLMNIRENFTGYYRIAEFYQIPNTGIQTRYIPSFNHSKINTERERDTHYILMTHSLLLLLVNSWTSFHSISLARNPEKKNGAMLWCFNANWFKQTVIRMSWKCYMNVTWMSHKICIFSDFIFDYAGFYNFTILLFLQFIYPSLNANINSFPLLWCHLLTLTPPPPLSHFYIL